MLCLFVYGTLMRGGPRHHLLAGQRFIGTARTLPGFVLYDLGAYPGMVCAAEGGGVVAGELYEIDPAIVPALDRAEGAPVLYGLEEIVLADVPGPVVSYVYRADVSGRPVIADGRWRNALESPGAMTNTQ